MLAAALAALAVGSASAETIYITGATAFRSGANTAINKFITNSANGAAGTLLASDATDIKKAGNAVWEKGGDYYVACWTGSEAGIQTLAGPQTTTLRPAYVGSVTTNVVSFTNTVKPSNAVVGGTWTGKAGAWTNTLKITNMVTDEVASRPTLISFWVPTQDFSAASGVTKQFTNSALKTNAIGTIAFSDTYQISSAFKGGAIVTEYATNNLDDSTTNGISTNFAKNVRTASNNYTAITDDRIVGVVGFGFITSPNAAFGNGGSYDALKTAVIPNITLNQAKVLYTTGKVNAAQFTGSLDDTNKFVYGVGRSIDSGTRLITTSLLGLGNTVKATGINSGLNQVLVLGTNAIGKANSTSGTSQSVFVKADGTRFTNNGSLYITNFPADIALGKLCAKGHNGYTSGGELCKVVGALSNSVSTNDILIGYTSLADAAGASNNIIALEGVLPTIGTIKTGAYPFWSFEHLLVNNAASAKAKTFADSLYTDITEDTTVVLQSASKGTVRLADVTNNVTRAVDGGAIVKSWTNSVTLTNLPSYYKTAKQTAPKGAAF